MRDQPQNSYEESLMKNWKCFQCAHIVDATVDDYCSFCGSNLPELEEIDEVPEYLEGWPCSAGFCGF